MFEKVKKLITHDPPYGAKVTVEKKSIANGYQAKALSEEVNNLFAFSSK